MSLTLQAQQKLEGIGLTDWFTQHEQSLTLAAETTYDYVVQSFPAGSVIRKDDVAKVLLNTMEVHEGLQEYLASKKATQKYWFRDFVDLILDRVWDQII